MRDNELAAIRNADAAIAMAKALAAQVDRLTERVHELEQDRIRRHHRSYEHGQEQREGR